MCSARAELGGGQKVIMARKRSNVDMDACGESPLYVAEEENEVTVTVSSSGRRIAGVGDSLTDTTLGVQAPLADAVQIRVRKGEIVITIRTDELAAGIVPSMVRVEPEPAIPPARRRGARAPARAAAPSVGFATVPADRMGQGYSNFTLRADLADSYRAAYAQVKALGGVLTSSGAVRSLREPATPGRSKTSLHYTGRAIDLFIYTGMQGAADRYVVARNGGTDANPEWKLYCTSVAPLVSDPLFQPALIQEGELACAVWRKGAGYKTVKRRLTYFCLTDVLVAHGWRPIPARRDWKTNYLSCEWWHFQHHQGLIASRSRFGDELLQVWPAELVQQSGLMLDAVWAGRSFRAPAGAALARAPRQRARRTPARSPIARRPKKSERPLRRGTKPGATRSRKKTR